MCRAFGGWEDVAARLLAAADREESRGSGAFLNRGQCDSLRAIARRVPSNGVIIADEVGMGKTRIAVSVARCVTQAGGRVAVLVPPGLGYQWQDEFRSGGLNDVRPILRSLWTYLAAWSAEEPAEDLPWFRDKLVVISHVFTNWRLGDNPKPWRRALLPELYALWRQREQGRLPRFYRNNEVLSDPWVRRAAHSILGSIPKSGGHPAKPFLRQLVAEFRWDGTLDGDFRQGTQLRTWLEQSVGLGLGVFDLVILDEAHKNRGDNSGLSRLLNNVVWKTKGARQVCMTATPVELDAVQWQQTLGRIGLSSAVLGDIQPTIDDYSAAVRTIRQCWRSGVTEREEFKNAAAVFHESLSPYVLRRDKREDPHVQRFARYSELPYSRYRQERAIEVDIGQLSNPWLQAVCAAEALSCATDQSADPVAKRLRLSMGSGYGVATLLDQVRRTEEDARQLQTDQESGQAVQEAPVQGSDSGDSDKRNTRAKWWRSTVVRVFGEGDESLYDHPAIQAAVAAIEKYTNDHRKVLVFGRFTRPMRALTDLLNARQMWRALQWGEPWPQSRVHVQTDGQARDDDWPAVRAAHTQLQEELKLPPLVSEELDRKLGLQYAKLERARQRQRGTMIRRLRQGLDEPGLEPDTETRRAFDAFERSVSRGEAEDLPLLSRALMALTADGPGVGEDRTTPVDLARAFVSLVKSAADRDDPDADEDGDGEIDDSEADGLWERLRARIDEEYSRTQGSFARFMYGGTSPPARRMIQAAFNRRGGYPTVLVAQSMVGREGLNLHGACRTVVLLHPEWNPAVVEQQIGRVDRVGSDWSRALDEAVTQGTTGEALPRIEIRPVIFRGTYDEHNWEVLQDRWDDLRSQLHGVVVPDRLIQQEDLEARSTIQDLADHAPTFSPLRARDEDEN